MMRIAYIFSACAVNPNDFENVGLKKEKEMNFDAQFEGITLRVAHGQLQVIHTKVSGRHGNSSSDGLCIVLTPLLLAGFSVVGKDEAGALSPTARYVGT